VGRAALKRFVILSSLAVCSLSAVVVLFLWLRDQQGIRQLPLMVDLDSVPSSGSLTRAELVAEADRIAVIAGRETGALAQSLAARAAALRQTAYVLEGRRLDALEAQELWADAGGSAKGACGDALSWLALRAYLEPQPARQYRDLYLLRQRSQDLSCRRRVDRALSALAAYRPSEEELLVLRQEAMAGSPAAGAGQVEQTPNVHVVMPELKAVLDGPTKITKVEPFGSEGTARVVVRVTHPTRFSVGTVEAADGRGPRLFVDIQRATFEGADSYDGSGLLERVRLGAQEGATRVVLDLTKPAFHRVFYLPDPFRLVIDLSVEPTEKVTLPRDIRRIVLDPGHGGSDPGAIGPNGLREKDVTLDVAHRAAPILAREVGVSTLLTRDVDVFVPLDERAARANAFNADLFVSIHLNSSPDREGRGVMTFVLDSSRDEAAAQVAARENASTAAAAAELANALSRVESTERRAASELFARLLQRSAGVSLRQVYPEIEDHGVRRAGFYVLAGASMPAVLFEGSFISHPIEARYLDSSSYRQRLADSIANAVRAYREGR
jgi:N-acetylmuramoyl-L-alanine amidase